MNTPQQPRRCVCKHLRSKEMFYSETPLTEDQYHSGVYWCEETMKGLGPDGSFVDSEECTPSRSCFEE